MFNEVLEEVLMIGHGFHLKHSPGLFRERLIPASYDLMLPMT